MQHNKKLTFKTFDTKEDAIAHQQHQSDLLELTKDIRVFVPHEVPVDIAMTIAGFFDGDGCISMCEAGYLGFGFFQSYDCGEPPELLFIQRQYGGKMSRELGVPHRRTSWILNINVDNMEALLRDLVMYCKIKHIEAKAALDALHLTPTERLSLYHDLLQDGKTRTHEIDYTTLTLPYIAGLFVAEGSCGIGKKFTPRVQISQGSFTPILHAIKARLNIGSVSTEVWDCTNRLGCEMFLKSIAPFVWGQKAPQVALMLQFLAMKKEINSKIMTPHQRELCVKTRAALSRLKRL